MIIIRNNNTCSGLSIIFLIIIGFVATTCAGFDVFFPLSSVKVTIPVDKKHFDILKKSPIGQFQVVSVNRQIDANEFIYKLENNEDFFQINSRSGELFLGKQFPTLAHNMTIIISAINPRRVFNKILHMTIEIHPTNNSEYCSNYDKLCFWDSAIYSVMENKRNQKFESVKIGDLGPNGFNYLCPQYEIYYRLAQKSEDIQIKGKTLYTKRIIDHEVNGLSQSAFIITEPVKCFIRQSLDSDLKEVQRNINITVLDRNDNGPTVQEEKIWNFQLNDPHFQQNNTIGEAIIFIDSDSLSVNTHLVYEIHNDSFDILRPACNAYDTNHKGTVISCKLEFSRNGIFSKSPYCVQLEASDMTVESNISHSAKTNICIHTDLDKIHEVDRPTAMALRAESKAKSKSSRITSSENSMNSNESIGKLEKSIPLKYSKDVFVYRTAKNLSRVTQPDGDVIARLMKDRRIKFSLIEDKSMAFGITSSVGIIFVKNVTALLIAPESIYFLSVSCTDKIDRTFKINIHLEDGKPANSSCDHREKSRTQSCSQARSKKYCNKYCGLGTNGGACEWRGINSGFNINYASCVPNATFCPDNICDPLEDLDHFLCPQDCAPGDKIVGPHSTNGNNRGILSASGTCTCDETGKCTCAYMDDEDEKPKRNGRKSTTTLNPNKNATTNSDTSLLYLSKEKSSIECGPSCLALAIGCPIVLIIIVICLIISRRKYIRQAKGKMLTKGGNFDCENHNGDLPLVPLENSFKFDSTNTKWELARDNLILDTVLGEGEFGKVVKAFASNINDNPGVTTVAVKMLKTGANSVEHLALLSEFQLLQEVSHPNVIKLIGACTKGDSPWLIIEYAKHGSLLSYLRLSRKIECAGVDFTDGVEPVTVKDILSFAWQICKGMAYLTEIKLVHRDLAARNVLLAEGKICKVSDFGLTRDVYEDDAYLKQSRDRVPVKWMAPESLADHVYTTKSDVWAFGILAWELITLGHSPYPGVPPQNLYHLLKSGYRMERPGNCSEEIYSIIRSCWIDDPNARPSFKYLASEWEKLLGNNAKYLELEISAVSNPLYCSEDDDSKVASTNLSKLSNDIGEPECLEHLWHAPEKTTYGLNENSNSNEHSLSIQTQVPPGYDLPRSLLESKTSEQILRYENDLRFPLNIRCGSTSRTSTPLLDVPHYSVPAKRGKSYMDMTNKTLIADNLDNEDIEKKLSKNISFRFSSLLNLNEHDNEIPF